MRQLSSALKLTTHLRSEAPVRKTVALIASVTLLAALTACSTDGSASANCTPRAESGSATQALDITGGFGSVPTVVIPSPLKTSTTQRDVITEGTGAMVTSGETITIDVSIYDGETGKVLQDSTFDRSTTMAVTLSDTATLPGIVKALECLPIGTRVAAVIAPEDAFGATGNAQAGVAPNSSIILVADIVSAALEKANGASQPATDGFPAVVLDDKGVPGITIPKTAAPTDFKVAVLKKGDGPVVAQGATVTVHYTGALWSDNSIFDSSWTKGSPVTFSLTAVVPGFAHAIEGQTVGSQVIAIIPPALGYGDQASGAIPAGSTLVFVIDILAAN
jgi:FKBP-type peptidyl-prolyl cis-trans isomerase